MIKFGRGTKMLPAGTAGLMGLKMAESPRLQLQGDKSQGASVPFLESLKVLQ